MVEELGSEDSQKVAEAAMQELKIAASSRQSKKKPPSLCQECSEQIFRYQCPRCSRKTCSLKCCRAHKERTGCNGKRDRTKFLPLAHMSDGTIDSDYHFLEDVLGAVERAKRSIGQGVGTRNIHNQKYGNKKHKIDHNGNTASEENSSVPHPMLQQIDNFKEQQQTTSLDTNSDNKEGEVTAEDPKPVISRPVGTLPQNCWKHLGPKWRHFWQQANIRGTNVLLMPSGMQKRIANSSHIKKDIIHWKVDLRVHHIGDKQPTIRSLKLSEQCILLEELQKVKLDTTTRKIHWLFQKLPSPSNRPCYLELSDAQATLQSTLKGTTLIEYPTIEAVPEDMLSKFPRAIEEVLRNNNPGESTNETFTTGQTTTTD